MNIANFGVQKNTMLDSSIGKQKQKLSPVTLANYPFLRNSPPSSSSLSLTHGDPSLCEGRDGFAGSFRVAIWPFLMIGQLFGVMPLIGVKNRSLSAVHFKWKSFRTFYSLAIAALLLSYSILLVWRIVTIKIQFDLIATLVYYSINASGLISFFILGLNWPSLMQEWQTTESSLSTLCNRKDKHSYMLQIRLIVLIVFSAAFVEHTLSDGSQLHYIMACRKEQDTIVNFVNINVPYIGRVPIWAAFFVDFINISATFVWNYTDIFIMIVSIGLSTHFKLINKEMEMANIENLSHQFWTNVRARYTKSCDLVATVDKSIARIILFSYLNNLFLICKQLFESLRPLPTVYRMVYFWYSLFFLILRTFAVSLFAARIHDESRKPIKILRAIPSSSWNNEAKRLFDDVLFNTVTLSGDKFFFLTRKLILRMAGTIVTYELVLMQFNQVQHEVERCEQLNLKTEKIEL